MLPSAASLDALVRSKYISFTAPKTSMSKALAIACITVNAITIPFSTIKNAPKPLATKPAATAAPRNPAANALAKTPDCANWTLTNLWVANSALLLFKDLNLEVLNASWLMRPLCCKAKLLALSLFSSSKNLGIFDCACCAWTVLRAPVANCCFNSDPPALPEPAKAPCPTNLSAASVVFCDISSELTFTAAILVATALNLRLKLANAPPAKALTAVDNLPNTKAPIAPNKINWFPRFLFKKSATGAKPSATKTAALIAKSLNVATNCSKDFWVDLPDILIEAKACSPSIITWLTNACLRSKFVNWLTDLPILLA